MEIGKHSIEMPITCSGHYQTLREAHQCQLTSEINVLFEYMTKFNYLPLSHSLPVAV